MRCHKESNSGLCLKESVKESDAFKQLVEEAGALIKESEAVMLKESNALN